MKAFGEKSWFEKLCGIIFRICWWGFVAWVVVMIIWLFSLNAHVTKFIFLLALTLLVAWAMIWIVCQGLKLLIWSTTEIIVGQEKRRIPAFEAWLSKTYQRIRGWFAKPEPEPEPVPEQTNAPTP